MRARGWLAGAVVAGGVVMTMRGCLSKKPAPDERLAGRLTDLCEIAKQHIDTPEAGLRTMGRYLDRHTGDLLGEWGDTLAAIERIPNDDKHDDRARLARDRIRRPLNACQRDWMRFGQAVENDPAAKALLEHFSERLSRTFEIIGSGVTLRDLPAEMDRALSRL
jgi:hypothetical protein